ALEVAPAAPAGIAARRPIEKVEAEAEGHVALARLAQVRAWRGEADGVIDVGEVAQLVEREREGPHVLVLDALLDGGDVSRMEQEALRLEIRDDRVGHADERPPRREVVQLAMDRLGARELVHRRHRRGLGAAAARATRATRGRRPTRTGR